MGQQLTIVLTITLGSIESVGPGFRNGNVSYVRKLLEFLLKGSLIFGVDRLLDMLRTVVNVTGDALSLQYLPRGQLREVTKKKS